ncbi:testis-specific Y-encoded protein 8-like [Cynocephalus volans]|uniref:testis-specific Y-encoded protein 8-like n=1 Tax=Cynocephalus volans TaxID=110931 RepID=UPI002FC78506
MASETGSRLEGALAGPWMKREAAATGQEVALDLLDLMEVLEVVAEEQEEGDEDDRQAPLASGPVGPVPPLEAWEILQLELGAVNARGGRASARLKRRLGQTHIAVISAQDEDVLSYMTDLQVEELDHSTDGCRMLFCFRNNPYFRNAVIMKQYHLSLTGHRASCSSKIQWFWDDEVQAPFPTEDTISLSFFDWLCDHNWPGSDRIAEIIIEDLWLNPLKYYPRRKTT